jgi:hypothetical protein
MQLAMVGIIIAFPGIVTVYKSIPDQSPVRREWQAPISDPDDEDLTAAFGGVSDRAIKQNAAKRPDADREADAIGKALGENPGLPEKR